MKVNVKLYGRLSRSFDGYEHSSGLEVIMPEGSSLLDLLVYLNLSPKGLGIISMDGRLLKKNSQLKDGSQIKIFQPIAGG